MEWWQGVLIGLLSATPGGLWALYVHRQGRRDRISQAQIEADTEIETAHLTEGASIRKDLREMLKDEQARGDRMEAAIQTQWDEIFRLKETVNNLSFIKTVLEKENAGLKEENAGLETQVKELTTRVFELEGKVKELSEHQQHLS